MSAYSKPNLDLLFKPIVRELSNLENGIKLKIDEQTASVKFFLLMGAFDKPARPKHLIQNYAQAFMVA